MGALLSEVKDKFGDKKAHLCMIINSYHKLDAYNQLHPGLQVYILQNMLTTRNYNNFLHPVALHIW